MPSGPWTLQGRDVFAHEDYRIEGAFTSEAEANAAAQACLEELERDQPTASSGGQDGIQDQVWVLRPDGTRFRVRPSAGDPPASGARAKEPGSEGG